MKAPNTLGRDIFRFEIRDNGLYPSGCGNDEDAGCNTKNGHGCGCACKVIQEGAMNY